MQSTLLVLSLICQTPRVPSDPAKAYSSFVRKVQGLSEGKKVTALKAISGSAKDPFEQMVASAYLYSLGDKSGKEILLNALSAGPKWLALVPATEGSSVGLVWPTIWAAITELAQQGDPRAIHGMFAMSNVADGAASEGMSGDIGDFMSQHPQMVFQNWPSIREFRDALSGGYEFGIAEKSLPTLRKTYSELFSAHPKFKAEILKILSGPRG